MQNKIKQSFLRNTNLVNLLVCVRENKSIKIMFSRLNQ